MKKEEEKGEFRPLVLKTDRESVLRGEDYWIDYSEVMTTNRAERVVFALLRNIFALLAGVQPMGFSLR